MKLRIFIYSKQQQQQQTFYSQIHLKPTKKEKKKFLFLCVLCKVNNSIARLKLITSKLFVSVGDLPRMNVHMVVISGHTGRICTYV